jgi:hypothetical protein
VATDDVEDWPEFDGDPTTLDSGAIPVAGREAVTAPHLGAEFLAGREAGFTDGVTATLEALRETLAHVGVDGDAATKIVHRVRHAADRRG